MYIQGSVGKASLGFWSLLLNQKHALVPTPAGSFFLAGGGRAREERLVPQAPVLPRSMPAITQVGGGLWKPSPPTKRGSRGLAPLGEVVAVNTRRTTFQDSRIAQPQDKESLPVGSIFLPLERQRHMLGSLWFPETARSRASFQVDRNFL